MGFTTSKRSLFFLRIALIGSAFGIGAFAAHTNATGDTPEAESPSVPETKQPSLARQDAASTELSSPVDHGLLGLPQVLSSEGSSDNLVHGCEIREIRKIDGISLKHLECSDKQLRDESQAFVVSEDFTVPPALARRFHFWRRIYSLWSKHQYVLHLAPWPEVVLEACENPPDRQVTSTTAAGGSGDGAQIVKKVSESRRDVYAQLLRRMHEISTTPGKFTPEMRRIAKAMEHISEPNKYLTASESLRIQRGQKDFIAQGLAIAPKYLPWIEKEFASLGVPTELSKLAFIESSFNLKALSKVGASGVYQIMPETGKQYLRIQDGIDERNDPIKAGRAAARVLRFYYESLGSWPLAITAYNHGVGGIRRAMESVGSNRLEDLITRYEGSGFGFASKNFYTGFLAIVATLAQKDEHFPGIKKPSPLRFRLVKLQGQMALDDIQKTYRISPSEMIRLNPDISPQLVRNRGFLPKNYVLKVSSDAAASLVTTNVGNDSSKKTSVKNDL